MYTCAIITVSDKGYRGERIDETGPILNKFLSENGFQIVHSVIVPDEKELIKKELLFVSESLNVQLAVTNGGTGFSARDITPEATLEVVQRQIPGFAEVMRSRSLEITPKAMLSRAISGILNETIIINLPGSPKAALENIQAIMDALPHGIDILTGSSSECARKE